MAVPRYKLITDWSNVPLFFDINYLVRLLGITPETARRYCRENTIPAVIVGCDWRISKDLLRAQLEGRLESEHQSTPAITTDQAQRMIDLLTQLCDLQKGDSP